MVFSINGVFLAKIEGCSYALAFMLLGFHSFYLKDLSQLCPNFPNVESRSILESIPALLIMNIFPNPSHLRLVADRVACSSRYL